MAEEYPWNGSAVKQKRRDRRRGQHEGHVVRVDGGAAVVRSAPAPAQIRLLRLKVHLVLKACTSLHASANVFCRQSRNSHLHPAVQVHME